MLLALPAAAGPAAAQSSGSVILWNTLESVHKVENSRVGPRGAVIGARFAFGGPVDGQKVFLKFRETAPNSYQVILKVKRANVSDLADPVTVRVRSGGAGGSASVDLRGLITGSAAAD